MSEAHLDVGAILVAMDAGRSSLAKHLLLQAVGMESDLRSQLSAEREKREAAESRVNELEADLLTKFEIEARVATLSRALTKAKEALMGARYFDDISDAMKYAGISGLNRQKVMVRLSSGSKRSDAVLLEIEKEMGASHG